MGVDPTPTPSSFSDLGLPGHLLQALAAVGYESPSPIQAATIPPLMAGRDVLGQAQTGTGKTAAFALPVLAAIDLARKAPQALVLAPTRELAIQVAEAFQKYAAHLPGFHVLPIYGGQGYGPQLSALKRGVHVVVGTPGRVIDHLGRGSLDLSQLRCLVLRLAELDRLVLETEAGAVVVPAPWRRRERRDGAGEQQRQRRQRHIAAHRPAGLPRRGINPVCPVSSESIFATPRTCVKARVMAW